MLLSTWLRRAPFGQLAVALSAVGAAPGPAVLREASVPACPRSDAVLSGSSASSCRAGLGGRGQALSSPQHSPTAAFPPQPPSLRAVRGQTPSSPAAWRRAPSPAPSAAFRRRHAAAGTSSPCARAARPWRCSASTGNPGLAVGARPRRPTAGGWCLRRVCRVCSRYGGEEEQQEAAAERARVLLERLRQQARARQLKKRPEARGEGGEGERCGGAGPGAAGPSPGGEPREGRRKRRADSGERPPAQGQAQLERKQQSRSSAGERAGAEGAADGSTPSKKKKENRRTSEVPQERAGAGKDKLRL